MFGLGTPELVVIGLAIVLLFGAKKIPELMRGLGSGIKEFKQAASIDDDKKKIDEVKDEKNK